MESRMKFDLHVHSKYSFDSFLGIGKIIKTAKKVGLDGVAIVDHNTIRGGLEALKINRYRNFQVIVGAEIKTEYGDLLGLFLNEAVISRKFEEVIEEIKSQGGLSVLPHPFRKCTAPGKIINKVDLVEGFNARSRKPENKKAHDLALRFKKPMTAGSDAHLAFEIGNGITIVSSNVREALSKGNTEIEGRESNYCLAHGLSGMTKILKV